MVSLGTTHVGRQVNIGLSGQVNALVDMLGDLEAGKLSILDSRSSRGGGTGSLTGRGSHLECC